MAWSYAYPDADLYQSSPTDFWTWRAVKGNVEMRLTDVSMVNGENWGLISIGATLLDGNGNASGNTLQKYWGQTPGFTYLGYYPRLTQVRLRMGPVFYANIVNGFTPLHFASELRWDNNGGPA